MSRRDAPLMTIRVSRDGGRTWERPLRIHRSDNLQPLRSSVWPPCECHRCMPGLHRT